MSELIKRRERDAVLQSLQAGLVPKLGLHLIQVGRKQEAAALLSDLDRIEQAGAAFRIVIGRFGSGKSFFLNLVRTLALQRRLVVAQADFTMERRIHATQGQARALWSELMRNLATKAKLVAQVENEIGKFARPDVIRFADALPKTRSGKIMRRLLKDVAAGTEAKGDTSTLEDLSVIAKLRADEE